MFLREGVLVLLVTDNLLVDVSIITEIHDYAKNVAIGLIEEGFFVTNDIWVLNRGENSNLI